ncbi:MAG TPA: glycosyltransferase family 39 protein [Candidatus Acidoferrum sp.]|nr:glycosyltransferase family 39 protein [Candidatus Acidoferrum sp.]
MTETTNQSFEKPWAQTAARVGWAILIVATLYVSYFSHLGAIGFVGPDEPRYAWVARDMMETGDWVTPRLYGKPWFEKPPLYYWGAALCFKLFGVSEAAARLPSAISALLATLALAWLALRLYGAETARWLLLLLPTTVGMIGFSHAAATDMPFSGMLTVAMVCAAVVLGLTGGENTPIIPRTPWLALFLFGVFLGAAVLAKGPVAIILCGGTVLFWALFTKRWREAFRLLHPATIAAFCLTALPWYILCARRNSDFFRIFIIEHNFKRYLTPEFQHIQPFWYFVPVLIVALIPWTYILGSALAGATGALRTNSWREPSTLFFACWVLFVFLFFALSKSKLPGYVLPAVPALTLIIAEHTSKRVRKSASRNFRIGFGATVTLLCLALAMGITASHGAALFHPSLTRTFGGPFKLAMWILICLALIAFVLALLGRTVPLMAVSIFAVLAASFVLLKPVPWNAPKGTIVDGLSARSFAEPPYGVDREFWINRLAVYKLNRSYEYGLDFYLHKELPQWPQSKNFPFVLTSHKGATELTDGGYCCESPLFFKSPVVACKLGANARPSP